MFNLHQGKAILVFKVWVEKKMPQKNEFSKKPWKSYKHLRSWRWLKSSLPNHGLVFSDSQDFASKRGTKIAVPQKNKKGQDFSRFQECSLKTKIWFLRTELQKNFNYDLCIARVFRTPRCCSLLNHLLYILYIKLN